MKNQGNRTFKTTNLDLASLLVCQGYVCQPKVLGRVYAQFTFEKTADVEKIANKFLKGECSANITAYMYARVALKRELQQQLMNGYLKPRKSTKASSTQEFKQGEYYFFVDGGKPFKQIYGDREPHTTRVANGNAYRTLEEAQAAIDLQDF